MTRRTLVRAFSDDLRIRSSERMIIGTACPFDTETTITEPGPHGRMETYTERFQRGAFARTIKERGAARVKVLSAHDHARLPLGRAHLLREDSDGLHCELKISATAAGDEILTLIEDGAVDALSVGFVPVAEDRSRDGVVIRTEVALREISVCSFGAYETALISGTRAQGTSTAIARERTNALRTRFRELLP